MSLEDELYDLNRALLDAFCDLQEARINSLQYRPENHVFKCGCPICVNLDSRVQIATNTYYHLREFLGKVNEPS